MRIAAFIFIAAAALSACNTPQTPTETATTDASLNYFGDTITADGALSPSQFLAMVNGQDSVAVKLETTINQTCPMKGCWMTVDLGNGEEMRVRFKDYGFFVPKEGAEGKTAIFEGYALVETTSVADLRHLAEDEGKSEEEILAITEPEVGINFLAHGVIIKD